MSDRMTSIRLRGLGPGLADWGRKTPAEMIAFYRANARADLVVAEAILAAKDEDFEVATYVGPIVQRKYEVLQPGKQP